MKYTSTILFIFLTFFSFAQPTGDIEKDTALANRYFEQAILLNNDSSVVLLKQAIVLYEAHPFDKQLLELKGTLAKELFDKQKKEAEEEALATIQLAKEKLPNVAHPPVLGNAYYALFKVYENRDAKLAIEYAFHARTCFKENLPSYFLLTSGIIHKLAYLGDLNLVDSLNTDLEQILITQKNKELDLYWTYIYQNKMVYYFKRNAFEKATIYGKKFFAENDKYQVNSRTKMSPYYIMMGQIYTALKNYDEAIKWTKEGIENTSMSKDSPAYGAFYTDLAVIYKQKGDLEEAVELYKKGLNQIRKDSITYQRRLLLNYFNLSSAYITMEDYPNAEKYLKESQKFGAFAQTAARVISKGRSQRASTVTRKAKSGSK